MKVLVAIKRVIDPYVKIKFNADKNAIDTRQVKMAMNPFDEIAVEEAIRLKEKGQIEDIVAISIGGEASQETLRQALAIGATKAILVQTEIQYDSLNIAKILKKITEIEKPDFILMGKQSIDGDNNQTPQMLAALLDWPQATYASKLILNDKQMDISREIDEGIETIRLTLPAVISTDLRLNEPRYATLPNIMKAKQKPLEVIKLETLDLNLQRQCEVINICPPTTREKGVMLNSITDLLEKLKQEAKVLP